METSKLKQPTCFKNVLTLEWKLESMLFWGRGYAFVSTGNQKLWFSSKLIKISFE